MRLVLLIAAAVFLACKPAAGHATLTVDAAQVGHPISPLIFGDQIESAETEGIWDRDTQAPRPEAFALTQELGLTILRYPGGTPSDFFHWEETIGPVADRIPQINPFLATATNEARQPVPFGPDEFAAFAGSLGAQLLITANVGTGTSDEAARWLQHYVNNGVDAHYWEIGNEVYLVGGSWAAVTQRRTPEEYAALFDQFARALRAVDPTVQIGVLGCHDTGAFPLCEFPDWNARVFAAVTEKFDFVAVHNSYAPAMAEPFMSSEQERLYKATLAAPEYFAANFALQEAELQAHAAPINQGATFAVTEHASFFVPVSDVTIGKQLERNRSLGTALFSAASYNVFLSDPRIFMTEHLKLVSPYWQCPINTSPEDATSGPIRSAYFQVVKLYREAAGGSFVPMQVSCDATFDSDVVGLVPAMTKVPALHAIAVRPPSGPDQLWLYVVNRDLERDVEAQLALTNLTVAGVQADVLNAPAYWSLNSQEHPDAVTVTSRDLGATTTVTFPAHSLTRLRIQ